MLRYDPAFNPPAPYIDVRVYHPLDASKSTPCRAKLDTGADMCVIPDRLVSQLQLRPYRTITARGYDRVPMPKDVYVIRIDVEGQPTGPLDAVATP